MRPVWVWLLVGGALIWGFGMGLMVQRYSNPTPAPCLEALTYADSSLESATEGFYAAADGFYSISERDLGGVERASARMRASSAKMKAGEYREAAALCRQMS